jgi:hypothetical protein
MAKKPATKKPATKKPETAKTPAPASAAPPRVPAPSVRLRLRRGAVARREIAGMRLPEHSEESPEFEVASDGAAVVLRHHAHVYERVEEPTKTDEGV